MHRLPKDFDPSVIEGRTLEQVCFNSNQIAPHFDDDLSIIVESAFSHITDPPTDGDRLLAVPVSTSYLMQLLQSRVSQATGDEQGTLTLVFENNHTLKIYDNSEDYESYTINSRGQITIV
jgi:hypothetical protein